MYIFDSLTPFMDKVIALGLAGMQVSFTAARLVLCFRLVTKMGLMV